MWHELRPMRVTGSPLGFYERYGFEQTGDRVFDNEILLRLEIT